MVIKNKKEFQGWIYGDAITNQDTSEENFYYNYSDPLAWRMTYKKINVAGKTIGMFRLDWGDNYRQWEEKEFIEHLLKLKGLNQK